MLYWACMSRQSPLTISKILELDHMFIYMPYYQFNYHNLFHVCAKVGNINALQQIFAIEDKKRQDLFVLIKTKNYIQYRHNKYNNSVYKLSKKQYDNLDKKFQKQIRRYDKWIFNFEQDVKNYKDLKELSKKYVNQLDFYQNNPIHYANILGDCELIRYYIDKQVKINQENREGIKPKQYTQIVEVAELYTELAKTISTEQLKLKEMNHDIFQTIQKKLKSDVQMSILKKKKNKIISKDEVVKDEPTELKAQPEVIDMPVEDINELNLREDEQIIVDFVIKFKLQVPKLQFIKKITKSQQSQRINFYLNQLILANFNIYICESYNKNHLYAMLNLSEEETEKQLQNLKIKLKLFEGFNYELFEKSQKKKFEPLSSRQRQEVLLLYLNQYIDLEMLQSQGVVENYYLMHNQAGLQKVGQKWMNKNPFKYQPIVQFYDYLKEGSEQNFDSMTYLKQYFGEKISFYFAWLSFVTLFLIFQLVPGFFINIAGTSFIESQFSASESYAQFIQTCSVAWTIYTIILQTFVCQFWKRKSCEINVRWGTLQYIYDDKDLDAVVRKEFQGDDIIDQFTGEELKSQFFKNILYKYSKYFANIILLILLTVAISLFYVIQQQIEKYQRLQNKNIVTLFGIVNGIQIGVLNFIYQKFCYIFVDLENHKFQKGYEKSFALKIFPFIFFNGMISICYNAFIKNRPDNLNNNLEWQAQVAQQLIPLAISQSVSSMVNKIIPYILFKYQKKNYFKYIQNYKKRIEKEEGSMDQVSYHLNKQKTDNNSLTRVVMNLTNKSSELMNKIDMDSIEINSFKKQLGNMDIITQYSLSLTKYSYVIIFSCIYPEGAVVLCLLNIIEIRVFTFALTHCFQRPLCERVTSIGTFQNYWDTISYVSVFTNLFLLLKFDTLDIEIDGKKLITSENKWIILINITIFIFIVKALLQFFIQNTPAWVLLAFNIILAQNSKSNKKKELDGLIIQNYEKRIHKNHRNYMKKIQKYLKVIKQLNEDKKEIEEGMQIKLNQQKTIVIEKNYNSSEEYEGKVYGILKYTQLEVEHGIVMKRVRQVNQFDQQLKQICEQCEDKQSLLRCEECQINLCHLCFDTIHFQQQGNTAHKIKFLFSQDIMKTQVKKNQDLLETVNSTQGKTNSLGSTMNNMNQSSNTYQKIKSNNKDGVREKKIYFQSEYQWKKLQQFSITLEGNSIFLQDLCKIFNILKKIYIKNNGINSTYNLYDLDSFLKYDNLVLKPNFQINQEMREYFEFQNFNNEDKIFINRLSFLTFKKYHQNSNFSDFLDICKSFIEGDIYQKCQVLAEMLNNGQNQINRGEFEQFICNSYVRDINQYKNETNSLSAALECIFSVHQNIDKQLFIDNILRNDITKYLMIEILQEQ